MSIFKPLAGIRKRYIFIVFIVGIGVFLRFYKLDQRWLWQDEAETAILAQTVLKNGIPSAYLKNRKVFLYTGRLISFDQMHNQSDKGLINTQMYSYAQADFDSQGNLRYHPFGDIYLTALSFWLFGASTFTARLPFALLGVLAIFVVYRLGSYLYNYRVGLAAAFIQAINLNLIFYERMSRHPAFGNFCFLVTLLFYIKAIRENTIKYWIVANIFFVLVFYVNPLFAALIVFILLVHTVLVDNNILQLIKNKRLIISGIVCLVLTLPYALILKPWTATNMFVSLDDHFFWDRIIRILFYIPELMGMVSFFLVTLGIITLFRRRTTSDHTLISIFSIYLFALLFLLPTTAGPYNTTLPLISIFAVIASRGIIELHNYAYSRFGEKKTLLAILITPILVVLLLFPKITRIPLELDKEFMEYRINKIYFLSFNEYLMIAKRHSIYAYLKGAKNEATFRSNYNQWNPMWLPEVIEFLNQKQVDRNEWVFTTYQNPTFLFYSDLKVQSIWPVSKNFLKNYEKRFWIIIGPNDNIRSPSKWYYGYVGWEEKDRDRNYQEVIQNARTYQMKSGAIIYECNPIPVKLGEGRSYDDFNHIAGLQ